jgi:hypothetical protein
LFYKAGAGTKISLPLQDWRRVWNWNMITTVSKSNCEYSFCSKVKSAYLISSHLEVSQGPEFEKLSEFRKEHNFLVQNSILAVIITGWGYSWRKN